MSQHVNCIVCGTNRKTVTQELNEAKALLNKLKQELNEASTEAETSRLKQEVEVQQTEVDKLSDQNQLGWLDLTNTIKNSGKKRESQTIQEIETQLAYAQKNNNAEERNRLEIELALAKATFKSFSSYIGSKHGTSHVCERCVDIMLEKIEAVTGVKKERTGTAMVPSANGASASADLASMSLDDVPKLEDLRKYLSDHIIGQALAKAYMAGAVTEHYHSIILSAQGKLKSKFKKDNVLLIGPSGTGKTLILQVIREFLSKYFGEIPLVSMSATKFTEAGYIGEDVDVLIQHLFNKALNNVVKQAKAAGESLKKLGDAELEQRAKNLTEIGIVHIDEIDKIVSDNNPYSSGSGREGVQDALLTMLEGDKVTVKIGQAMAQRAIEIDTTNILFVASGAFSGEKHKKSIYEIAQQSSSASNNSESTVGFNAQISSKNEKAAEATQMEFTDEHVIEYGLKPELTGRLTNIISLTQHSLTAMKRIVTEPQNAVLPALIEKLQVLHNVEIEVTPEAIEAIAKKALASPTGARALKAVVNNTLFALSKFPEFFRGKKVVIGPETVADRTDITVIDPETGETSKPDIASALKAHSDEGEEGNHNNADDETAKTTNEAGENSSTDEQSEKFDDNA